MSREREYTAYHEAGHAVACWALRRRIREVTIVPDPEAQSLGHILIGKLRSLKQYDENAARLRHLAEREMMHVLAGPAAEAKYKGRRNHIGASQDYRDAIDLSSLIHQNDSEAEAHTRYLAIRAQSMITGLLYWPFVEAVAAALLKSPRLTAAQVRKTIREEIDRQNAASRKAMAKLYAE